MQAVTDIDALEVDADLLDRVRSEFREMPGLCLTRRQARRLWALDGGVCDRVIDALVEEGFLRRTRDGSVVRSDKP